MPQSNLTTKQIHWDRTTNNSFSAITQYNYNGITPSFTILDDNSEKMTEEIEEIKFVGVRFILGTNEIEIYQTSCKYTTYKVGDNSCTKCIFNNHHTTFMGNEQIQGTVRCKYWWYFNLDVDRCIDIDMKKNYLKLKILAKLELLLKITCENKDKILDSGADYGRLELNIKSLINSTEKGVSTLSVVIADAIIVGNGLKRILKKENLYAIKK